MMTQEATGFLRGSTALSWLMTPSAASRGRQAPMAIRPSTDQDWGVDRRPVRNHPALGRGQVGGKQPGLSRRLVEVGGTGHGRADPENRQRESVTAFWASPRAQAISR